MNQKLIKRIVSWLLLATTLIYIITGFGVSQFRIIERLTLGLLNKGLSLRIHESLIIPYLTLLSLHVLFRPFLALYKKSLK